MTSVPPPVRFDLARIREITSGGSRRFWSSLEELLDEDGFRRWVAAEFPAAASMFDDPGRRQFLKLMGASLLLGGLTGCGETKSDQALPYVNQPENMAPGVAKHYATAVLFEGCAQPVLAKTYAGRPVKLDGNPDHPATLGKSDPFMQSAIFELYDPERSKMPLNEGSPSTWDAFAAALARLRARWRDNGGEGFRLLSGETTSPTLLRQIGGLTGQFPKLRWHRHEPVGSALQNAATAIAFGRPLSPHYRLDRCDVVVSLDYDLLGPGVHQVEHAGGWAQRRGEISPTDGRIRMHVAESVPSPTGFTASTRLPCDRSRLGVLAQAVGAHFSLPNWTMPDLQDAERTWLDRAVTELKSHPGRSLLVLGPYLDPTWQALGPAINDRLGNNGVTVWYSEPVTPPLDDSSSLQTLATDIAAGAVDTLIVLDSNPAYTAPGGLGFTELLARVPHRIHIGLHHDETATRCSWHLPLSHALESWSDARATDGTATILQPVIATLYDSRTAHQLLDMLNGTPEPAADASVRATWNASFGDSFADRWRRSLHDGFVTDTAAKPVTMSIKVPAPPQPISQQGKIEIAFRSDPSIWDGRFANIAWLQELPKPLSKITWGNVVAVSPALAAEHHLSNGDTVAVSANGRTIQGPAWIVPGQAPHTVALSFGYGRTAGGEIAQGHGYDAYALQPAPHAFAASGSLIPTSGRSTIATTQAHHRMDGFDFVREVTAKQPATAAPKDDHSFYPDWNATPAADHAWAMAIDLDRCIGCNACISACNVENNVLAVGKDQVSRGREMIWLRVDRYYIGDIENPKSFFQPVPCMHCEKAPCEMGCPVHATVHSPDGINQMVYNRCIGTRTCSSYCPYKVRRFNWYDYRKLSEAEQAAKNPDVTVRSRGVMEKCTYCTQRIQAAEITAAKENRPLRRDEVATACQQACPTQAIVFGDLQDTNSTVSAMRRSGRHYALLEELGTRPRTTYLARWNDSEDQEGGA